MIQFWYSFGPVYKKLDQNWIQRHIRVRLIMRKVTKIDSAPKGDPLWLQFDKKLDRRIQGKCHFEWRKRHAESILISHSWNSWVLFDFVEVPTQHACIDIYIYIYSSIWFKYDIRYFCFILPLDSTNTLPKCSKHPGAICYTFHRRSLPNYMFEATRIVTLLAWQTIGRQLGAYNYSKHLVLAPGERAIATISEL